MNSYFGRPNLFIQNSPTHCETDPLSYVYNLAVFFLNLSIVEATKKIEK